MSGNGDHSGMVHINGKWVCDFCGRDPCRCYWDNDLYEEPDLDIDVDVCQNCGGYFERTPELTATWRKHWHTTDNDRQPQRCRRCLVDECWVEDRDQ